MTKPLSVCLLAVTLMAAIVSKAATGDEPPEIGDQVDQPIFNAPGEIPHPVTKVIQIAEQARSYLDRKVNDYSGAIVTRQVINGSLSPYQKMVFKIRHKNDASPFSMYAKFVEPQRVEGRELMFVDGRFDNQLIVRRGGVRLASLTTAVDPTSPLAATEGDMPVTEVGLKDLLARYLEVAESELSETNIEVRYFKNAKIDGRLCTQIRLVHPNHEEGLTYYWADMFIDQEWKVPVRFAAYDWPSTEGAEPPLLEEVTFVDLRINTGLTDADFDVKSNQYKFGGVFVR